MLGVLALETGAICRSSKSGVWSDCLMEFIGMTVLGLATTLLAVGMLACVASCLAHFRDCTFAVERAVWRYTGRGGAVTLTGEVGGS